MQTASTAVSLPVWSSCNYPMGYLVVEVRIGAAMCGSTESTAMIGSCTLLKLRRPTCTVLSKSERIAHDAPTAYMRQPVRSNAQMSFHAELLLATFGQLISSQWPRL